MESSIQAWFGENCRDIPGVRHGIVLLGSNDGQSLAGAVWPPDSRPPVEVHAAAHDALVGRLPIQRISPTDSSRHRIFSLPIRVGDRAVGALAIGLAPEECPPDDEVLGRLRRALVRLHPLLGKLPGASSGTAEVLRLNATLLSHPRLAQGCTAFANQLAGLFRCDRVAIGLVERGIVRIVAVSHDAGQASEAAAFAEIEAAMEEAVDQAAAIRYPPPANAKPRITLAHATLARLPRHSIMTLPLAVDGNIEGAITLEAPGEAGFTDDEQAVLEQIVGLLAPVLVLKRRAEESTWQRIRGNLSAYWAKMREPGVSGAKLAAWGLLAAIALLSVVPMPYRVSAPARVEGEIQRVLAAPTDGFLQEVHARPGDDVAQGQVLVELAQQDLMLERRKWEGERAQHENAYGAAMAKGDRVQLAMSMARLQEAQAQLDLVEQQLQRARLVAPFDGIVAEGDLTQSLGAPVRKGDRLLTVAPRDRHRVIVEVDERDIIRIEAGQEGTLAPTARPGDQRGFVVRRIVPVATSIEERNVFEVEGAFAAGAAGADASAADPALRPGMKGVAKISAGYRPLGWILFHRLGNWLHLNLWRWGF